jgi:hypothetical protein
MNDESAGTVYGVFGNEFFHYTFSAGHYPSGPEQAAELIRAGTDPAQMPHDELQRFPLNELKEIQGYEHWAHFDIRRQDAAGKTSEITSYCNAINTFAVARELATAIPRPSRESEPRASVLGLLVFPLLVLLGCGVLLGLIYLAANDLEQGNPAPIRVRRALARAVLTGAASTLGTKGVLVVGGIVLVLIFAWIVKNIVFWPRDLLIEFH